MRHRKKFVGKKKKSRNKIILKLSFTFLLIYSLYSMISGISLNLQLASSNQEFIQSVLNDSNHHMLYEKSNKNLFNRFILWVSSVNLDNPVNMLEGVFGYQNNVDKKTDLVYKEASDGDNIDLDIGNYIKDPNPIDVNNPKVYIYNTHQLEPYSSTNYEEYNITPNVMMASYLMKEKLNKLGTSTIVETASITDFLAVNGWNYASSYKASSYYVKSALDTYSSLELLIDLHRDSIGHTASTTNIDGKNYAKVLFVVGLDYEGYEPNLELANTINNKIKEKYPTLTRGVITKTGAGVNGIYNQNLAKQALLIECGGVENTIEEVMNTIEVLSLIIHEYLGG